jgi:hypothetical protein
MNNSALLFSAGVMRIAPQLREAWPGKLPLNRSSGSSSRRRWQGRQRLRRERLFRPAPSDRQRPRALPARDIQDETSPTIPICADRGGHAGLGQWLRAETWPALYPWRFNTACDSGVEFSISQVHPAVPAQPLENLSPSQVSISFEMFVAAHGGGRNAVKTVTRAEVGQAVFGTRRSLCGGRLGRGGAVPAS